MQSHRELQGTDHNSGIFSREFIKPPADTHRGKSLLLVQTDRPLIRHAHFKDNAGNLLANTYDLGNFQAVSDPASIKYTDGQVIYNGHFVANYTDSGSSYTADHHRTLRLVWEDGIWKVDAFSLLPDGAYSSTTYAPLP